MAFIIYIIKAQNIETGEIEEFDATREADEPAPEVGEIWTQTLDDVGAQRKYKTLSVEIWGDYDTED